MTKTKSILLSRAEVELAKSYEFDMTVEYMDKCAAQSDEDLVMVKLYSRDYKTMFDFLRAITDFKDYDDDEIETDLIHN